VIRLTESADRTNSDTQGTVNDTRPQSTDLTRHSETGTGNLSYTQTKRVQCPYERFGNLPGIWVSGTIGNELHVPLALCIDKAEKRGTRGVWRKSEET